MTLHDGRFDARRVLANAEALAAVDRMGAILREIGYRSSDPPGDDPPAIVLFACGESVALPAMDGALGTRAVRALAHAGALDVDATTARPRFCVLGAGSVLALFPKPVPEDDHLVYIGPDTFWLLQRVWSLATGGRIALDLGTGTGYVAAALAPRYQLTVGTDLLPSTAAAAALTFRLNTPARGRLAACTADVARGLRNGCADLVVANAPWVPSENFESGRRRRAWADGGAWGLELPTRFILEGAKLLAPGGTAITQCVDPRFGDDDPGPLAAVTEQLVARGFTVEAVPVGPPDLASKLTERFAHPGGPARLSLVDVIVERREIQEREPTRVPQKQPEEDPAPALS